MSILYKIFKYLWGPIIAAIALYVFTNLKDYTLGLVVLVSLSIIYALALVLVRKDREIKRLSSICKREGTLTGQENPQSYIRQLMLKTEDDIIDTSNRYKLLRFEAFIDEEGSYHAKYRFSGINMSDQHVTNLFVKTVADSNITYQEMKMVAWDLKNHIELLIDCYEDHHFRKKCNIHFRQPVPANGEFDVEWRFIWPRVMSLRRNYDAFNISRFKRGVDKLEIELTFDWLLTGFILIEIKDAKETPCDTQPTHDVDKNQRHVYKWSFENPKAESYIFSYF